MEEVGSVGEVGAAPPYHRYSIGKEARPCIGRPSLPVSGKGLFHALAISIGKGARTCIGLQFPLPRIDFEVRC